MSDETDLAGWLLAQVGADERVAREAADAPSTYFPDGPEHVGERWNTRPGDGMIYGAPAPKWGEDRLWDDEGGSLAPDPAVAVHIALHDPARVLAECAARRRIIALHGSGPPRVLSPIEYATLLALAQPYAGREGWRAEWVWSE